MRPPGTCSRAMSSWSKEESCSWLSVTVEKAACPTAPGRWLALTGHRLNGLGSSLGGHGGAYEGPKAMAARDPDFRNTLKIDILSARRPRNPPS